MNELLNRLEPKARRGSKPRCHWLTYGNTAQVAERLTRISESRAIVSPGDRWMPQGFTVPEEAQLNQAPRLLSSELGLRRMIFVGQASLRHAITQYMSHYHGERNQGSDTSCCCPTPMLTNVTVRLNGASDSAEC